MEDGKWLAVSYQLSVISGTKLAICNLQWSHAFPLSCASFLAASIISRDVESLISTRSTIPTTAASIDMSWFPIAVRAALPNAHITISPVPAPRRSATTTIFRVGSLSKSYGWTIKNLIPSRSGVFLVDQTVPTTFARNIKKWSWAFGLGSFEGQRSKAVVTLLQTPHPAPQCLALPV